MAKKNRKTTQMTTKSFNRLIRLAFLIIGIALMLFAGFQTCHSRKPTVIHTEKTFLDTATYNQLKRDKQRAMDSIAKIKGKYIPVYLRIAASSQPDTFIRYILRTDTVKGNVDSFVAVQVAKGQECLEVQPWKDSILYDDSVQLWTLHKALNDCTKAHDKKVKSLKLWQRLSVGLGFILSGAVVVK